MIKPHPSAPLKSRFALVDRVMPLFSAKRLLKASLQLAFLCGMLMPQVSFGQWVQVWSDEFDGTGNLDQAKWNFETHEPYFVNNELQKYTFDRLENCRRDNGILTLEGRRDWWWDAGSGNTYEYTSARITTAWKSTTRYGKIEMSAILPWANGAWAAFWMMPQNATYGWWPDSGEIDILEYVGYDDNVAHFNAHTKDYNYTFGNNYGWGGWIAADLEAAYHTYTLEWSYERMDYYVDGIWRYGFANAGTGFGQWPFNQPFFIILNHAIGGDWGGVAGIDTATYDTAGDNYGVGFFVDWVRVSKWDYPDYGIPCHVEAEYQEGLGGDIREEMCSDVGGGWNMGFIDTGDFMQYNFNVPYSGWYQIDYRVASGVGGGLITLGKGGTDIKQTAIPDTGGWQTWKTVSDVIWLDVGAQTLDVYASIGGWNLNHFKINEAPTATQVEAEYYAAEAGTLTEGTPDGGGLNVSNIDATDWLSYDIDVPVAGTYDITYRVASVGGGGQLTLSAGGPDLATTAIGDTTGWQVWADVTDTVILAAGPQTITLYATAGGFNLNWWRYELVTASTVYTLPCHVEAEHYSAVVGGAVTKEYSTDIDAGQNITGFDTGEYLQYDFNVATAAWYQVDYRVASTSGGIVTLKKGGVDIDQATVPNTGGDQIWTTVRHVVWLDAGVQTLDVVATTGGWNFNHFKINAAPPATQIEAEYYSAMAGVQTEAVTDAGDGLNVGFIDTTDWMAYDVVIPTTGTYEISYRIASAQVGGGSVILGEGGIDIVTMAIPDTTGWQTWQTVTTTAMLTAGAHTYVLYADLGGWNMNWWRFEFLSSDYDIWETAHGIAGSGRATDVEGDGLSNETEYFFGTDPNSGTENLARIPAASVYTTGGTFPAFTYSRRVTAPATYIVETSEDLATWTVCTRDDGGAAANTYTQDSDSGDHGDGSQTIAIHYNVDFSAIAARKLFFRLKAVE